MIRITHPRPQAGRQSFIGVEFIDGVAEAAELHPEREQALLQHGFTIERLSASTSLGGFDVEEVVAGLVAVSNAGMTLPADVKSFAVPESVGEMYIPLARPKRSRRMRG